MKITHYNEVFPFIIIDEMYNSQELELVWEELDFLCHKQKFISDPHQAGTAIDEGGNALKQNKCFWIDAVYKERSSSNLLTVNRKLFDDKMGVIKSHPSWFFSLLNCNRDTTLLSYYENSDYYLPHDDDALVTSLTWFYKEPKKFSGGDLTLYYKDSKVQVECKNNRNLIFPSCVTHSVDQIHMDEKDLNKKMGRFCMTQFLSIQ